MKRINKRQARKAYESGKKIYFIPCKLNPYYLDGVFMIPEQKASNPESEYNYRFDELVNAFEFYNCINSETGKYTAFYIDE